MSLNAYEIRLELLKLAQTTLNEQVFNERQSLMDKYTWQREGVINPSIPFPQLPSMPTTEEIIAEAKKLNNFVAEKGDTT